MAAFYYDKIRITKNPTGAGVYDFEATSNVGGNLSGNAVTADVDTTNGDGTYTIPVGETAFNQVNFPKISINFGTAIYTADKLFCLANTYPQYANIVDNKGGFCIKDTKYPPPTPSRLIKLLDKKSFSFDQGGVDLQPLQAADLNVKKITFQTAITGRFEFTSIELTRVLDKTYTAKIVLKDNDPNPLFIVSDMYLLPDRVRNNRSTLVLALKQSGTPVSSLVFDKPQFYLPLGDTENGMPIIIYDETTTAAANLDWTNVKVKNGTLYFD